MNLIGFLVKKEMGARRRGCGGGRHLYRYRFRLGGVILSIMQVSLALDLLLFR